MSSDLVEFSATEAARLIRPALAGRIRDGDPGGNRALAARAQPIHRGDGGGAAGSGQGGRGRYQRKTDKKFKSAYTLTSHTLTAAPVKYVSALTPTQQLTWSQSLHLLTSSTGLTGLTSRYCTISIEQQWPSTTLTAPCQRLYHPPTLRRMCQLHSAVLLPKVRSGHRR